MSKKSISVVDMYIYIYIRIYIHNIHIYIYVYIFRIAKDVRSCFTLF